MNKRLLSCGLVAAMAMTCPVHGFSRLLRDMSRMFQEAEHSLAKELGAFESVKGDLKEEDDKYILQLQVPGFKKDDITINVRTTRGMPQVTVSADVTAKEEETKEEDGQYHFKQISRQSFKKSVLLAHDIKNDDIKASIEDGILTIEMPKKEETKKAKEGFKVSID